MLDCYFQMPLLQSLLPIILAPAVPPFSSIAQLGLWTSTPLFPLFLSFLLIVWALLPLYSPLPVILCSYYNGVIQVHFRSLWAYAVQLIQEVEQRICENKLNRRGCSARGTKCLPHTRLERKRDYQHPHCTESRYWWDSVSPGRNVAWFKGSDVA